MPSTHIPLADTSMPSTAHAARCPPALYGTCCSLYPALYGTYCSLPPCSLWHILLADICHLPVLHLENPEDRIYRGILPLSSIYWFTSSFCSIVC